MITRGSEEDLNDGIVITKVEQDPNDPMVENLTDAVGNKYSRHKPIKEGGNPTWEVVIGSFRHKPGNSDALELAYQWRCKGDK